MIALRTGPASRPRRRRPLPVMVLLRDPVFRTAVTNLLYEQGYAVRVVETVAEAIECADRDEPAAVILDTTRGWPEALLTARSLRFLRATHAVPIVALSWERGDETGDLTAALTVPFTGQEICAFLPWPREPERDWRSEWRWDGVA